ncbi:hypothetical protein B0H67DRAFT_640238 [Lasiosphaeris hirsuta]|uniref:Uncharacterized protein n=1 Tax=Lasiosphaeris hirsuta TaxID=260670 RepID=A0AA40BCU3_9PEZI|nr:hypothetical protein B0H67DRAFT_640238 [Lasiosphaeris hirsuta]
MESSMKRLKSVRRPKAVPPEEIPAIVGPDGRLAPPQMVLNRRESILVDPSDPAAAVASMAVEVVVGMVRRAKSTRDTRRVKRANSSAGIPSAPVPKLQRPRSLDLPSHPKLETPPPEQLQRSNTTSLKPRPSLLRRLTGRRKKPVSTPDLVQEEIPNPRPRTPTDKHFSYRPKHAAADFTDIAASLQVPRDSQDGAANTAPRPSYEINAADVLHRSKSQHAVVLPANGQPVAKGECVRCHSKRLVQRAQSSRLPTSHGLPKQDSIDTKPAGSFASNNPFATTAQTDFAATSGPLIDYEIIVTPEPGSDVPAIIAAAPDADSNALGPRRGHVKQAPSWASYHEGDSDVDKVQEYRKSQLPPSMQAAVAAVQLSDRPVVDVDLALEKDQDVQKQDDVDTPITPIAPTAEPKLRRQRSVAQRIVDYIRPMSKRSVKNPVRVREPRQELTVQAPDALHHQDIVILRAPLDHARTTMTKLRNSTGHSRSEDTKELGILRRRALPSSSPFLHLLQHAPQFLPHR